MKTWNNCEKISETGDVKTDVDGKVWGAYLKFLGNLGLHANLKGPIWYDKEASVCFGPDQDFFSSKAEFSFFHQEENFLQFEPWGKYHLQDVLGQFIGTDCNMDTEIIYHNHPSLDKYEDSTILVVGAGPSSVDVDWENEERDFTWSCTKFYLNEK